MPNRSYTSRSAKFDARVQVGEARDLGSSAGHLADRADAPVARVREEVGDHLEALRRDAGGHRALGVDEMVDGGHVDALRELLLVAQERGRRRATRRAPT